MTGLIALGLLYASVFVFAEIMQKKGFAAALTRKFAHIGAGMVSCFLPVLTSQRAAVALGIFFSIFLFWTKRKGVLDSIHRTGNSDIGAVLFPLGLMPCALLFWEDILIFSSSALILGFSDGLACIIGRRYGKKGYNITGYKTLEGSLVFFGVTLTIFIAATLLSSRDWNLTRILLIALGSLAVTVVEGFFGRGWDNLFIPAASALALKLVLTH